MKDQIIEFLKAEAETMKAQARGLDPDDRREQLANATGVTMAWQAVRDRFQP